MQKTPRYRRLAGLLLLVPTLYFAGTKGLYMISTRIVLDNGTENCPEMRLDKKLPFCNDPVPPLGGRPDLHFFLKNHPCIQTACDSLPVEDEPVL